MAILQEDGADPVVTRALIIVYGDGDPSPCEDTHYNIGGWDADKICFILR